MFIVSEELLERLTCSQCKKYLSVKPIKVYPNRGIKCGRCSNAGDAGVVSLFGVVAEQALFRCINRFEGCNLMLPFSEVAEHEKSCIGKSYECPCCIESFKGTAYEMYIHFQEQHSDQLLINTPEFVLDIDNELIRSYLYRQNDLLFYVNARYNRGDTELTLNVVYLGTEQDASKVTQGFTLHSLDSKLRYKTKRKSCCSVNGGNLKSFKIHVSPADFSKDVVVCRFDLDTENVENLVALPESFKKSKLSVEDNGHSTFEHTIFKPSSRGNRSIFTPKTTASGISNCASQIRSTTTESSSLFGNSIGFAPEFPTRLSSAPLPTSVFTSFYSNPPVSTKASTQSTFAGSYHVSATASSSTPTSKSVFTSNFSNPLVSSKTWTQSPFGSNSSFTNPTSSSIQTKFSFHTDPVGPFTFGPTTHDRKNHSFGPPRTTRN